MKKFILLALIASCASIYSMSPEHEQEYYALEYDVAIFNGQLPQENEHEIPEFYRQNRALLLSFARRMKRLVIIYPNDPRLRTFRSLYQDIESIFG
jgi:hypothetical protein